MCEPDASEIHYGYLFRTIDALGYDGRIGCEYKPATTTAARLPWMDPWLMANHGAGRRSRKIHEIANSAGRIAAP